jgi:hypothetical protein
MNDVYEALVLNAKRNEWPVFVDLVMADFAYPDSLPDADDHVALIRRVRRRCARNDDILALAGIIEPSFNEFESDDWVQLETHNIALVKASSLESAVEKADRAFRRSSDEDDKIVFEGKSLRVTGPDDAEGGVWGGLGYRTKSIHPGGVSRRSRYSDPNRNGNLNTRDLRLAGSHITDLEELNAAVPAHRRVILYGLKRVHGRYVRKDE